MDNQNFRIVFVFILVLLIASCFEGGSITNGVNSNLVAFAEKGDLEGVQNSLTKGADVNFLGNSGATALHVASQNGHKEIVAFLLKKSANVNEIANGGATALYLASQNGHKEIVATLLENNADVNQSTIPGNWTPLHIAADQGHTDIVQFLLANGADRELWSSDGKTALDIANRSENNEIVALLSSKEGDVEIVDREGVLTHDERSSREPLKTNNKKKVFSELAELSQQFRNSSDQEKQEIGNLVQDFLARAPKQSLPLWSEDNLGWHTNRVNAHMHILSRKPPFYDGLMPLEYTSGKSPGGVLFFHDFGDFRNQFKLNDSFKIIGSRTVDRTGRLLAEARARYYVNGNEQGIEIQEFHYDETGNVYFKCKSNVDSGTGFKVGEKDKNGQKRKEFYFLWPIR